MPVKDEDDRLRNQVPPCRMAVRGPHFTGQQASLRLAHPYAPGPRSFGSAQGSDDLTVIVG